MPTNLKKCIFFHSHTIALIWPMASFILSKLVEYLSNSALNTPLTSAYSTLRLSVIRTETSHLEMNSIVPNGDSETPEKTEVLSDMVLFVDDLIFVDPADHRNRILNPELASEFAREFGRLTASQSGSRNTEFTREASYGVRWRIDRRIRNWFDKKPIFFLPIRIDGGRRWFDGLGSMTTSTKPCGFRSMIRRMPPSPMALIQRWYAATTAE